MHTAMDICVAVMVVAHQRIDDRSGFLGGRSIVQIHERSPVDLFAQNREVGPDGFHIIGGGSGGSGSGTHPNSSQLRLAKLPDPLVRLLPARVVRRCSRAASAYARNGPS